MKLLKKRAREFLKMSIVRSKIGKDRPEAWYYFEAGNRVPAGFLIIDPIKVKRKIFGAVIHYLHVVSDFRGEGIGKSLIEEAQKSFYFITVRRLPDPDMIYFYKKCGFQFSSYIDKEMVWIRVLEDQHSEENNEKESDLRNRESEK